MRISIITVCYNSEAFIASAIDSVLCQTYSNVEYIVIDGGSKDITVSIVRAFGNRIAHFVSESDVGIYDAMNKGLALASGDVIGILNSDDFYPHENVLAEVAAAFKASPEVDMVLGNVDFVDPEDITKPVRYYCSVNFSPWKMYFGFMPAHPGAFIRRTAYEKVGGYKLGYKIAADFEWFVRCFLIQRLRFITLNLCLVRMRTGGVSNSGLKSYMVSTHEMRRSLHENGLFSSNLMLLFRLPYKLLSQMLGKNW